MYAIVDIERTTGGHAKCLMASQEEVAICLHDGKKVTTTYSTLVNPQKGNTNLHTSLNRYQQRNGA